MPRTLPEIKITVASSPCLSKIRASLATWITVDEPGAVEIYEVLSLSVAEISAGAIKSTAIRNRSSTARVFGFDFMLDLPQVRSSTTVLNYNGSSTQGKGFH